MIPAADFPEALALADRIAGADAGINVIPEGISVIPRAV